MTTKTIDFPLSLKKVGDDGTFEGYGSVFNVQDLGDDIVLPGAFAETLAGFKAAGRMPSLLWQHRQAEPIGVYTSVEEDSVGLKVAGQLALKTARGQEAHELMKMGAVTGMSIGYRTRESDYDKVTGVRKLKKVDLWEVSLVTIPMNDAARVSSVKGIEQIENLRDAEHFLRDSGGMSRAEAVAFMSRVKSLGQSDSDGGEMQQIVEALKRRGAAVTP